MKNHYIPQLLLKHFAENERVNVYDFKTNSYTVRKIKNTFMDEDIFPSGLEKLFATKLEGPFANLLNHKLLLDAKCIDLNREENLLIRKFFLINSLRSPIAALTWDEMIKQVNVEDHPNAKRVEFMKNNIPGFKEEFEKYYHKPENYISNLERIMDLKSLEDFKPNFDNPTLLDTELATTMCSCIAIWDASNTGQEFVLPTIQGISEMDQMGVFYKANLLRDRASELEKEYLPSDLRLEFGRLIWGSSMFDDNYRIFPISKNRLLIFFSPYFRAFFPTKTSEMTYPPIFRKEQYKKHFYKPMNMELFRPCYTATNKHYKFEVKQLDLEEVFQLNALLLDVGDEQFAFHDFNKIKESLRYYDEDAVFVTGKQHDYSHLY